MEKTHTIATLQNIQERFKQIQDSICTQLEAADGHGVFREDVWTRAGGGGGRTRVLQGDRIEKGGVNFSAVWGQLPAAQQQAMGLDAPDFEATGVSIVLHPHSPMAPIIHMNIRYFESGDRWWFGGGIDLTPHYVMLEDATWFHLQLKAVCDRYHPDFYAKYKAHADEYFYIKHRKETRGIGGIFFDYLSDHNTPLTKPQLFAFVCEVGNAFAPIYAEMLARAAHRKYSEKEVEWQRVRRGRYVEFNLVWDKGTKFGLETDGRTESILMSLPPLAAWHYDYQVEEGSAEAATLMYLKKGIDFVAL